QSTPDPGPEHPRLNPGHKGPRTDRGSTPNPLRVWNPSERAIRPRGSGRFSPLPASPLPKGRRPPIPPSLLPAVRLSWPPFLWVSPSFGRTFSWLLFLRIFSPTSFSLSFLLLSSFSFPLLLPCL